MAKGYLAIKELAMYKNRNFLSHGIGRLNEKDNIEVNYILYSGFCLMRITIFVFIG